MRAADEADEGKGGGPGAIGISDMIWGEDVAEAG